MLGDLFSRVGFKIRSMMVVSARPLVLFILCLNILSYFVDSITHESCAASRCYNGENVTNNGSNSSICQCYPGWHGDSCQYCGGKIRYNLYA